MSEEILEVDANKTALVDFVNASDMPANIKSAFLNYLVPLIDSLRDESTEGLQYLEGIIEGDDDPDEVIEKAKSAVFTSMDMVVRLLMHNGWYDQTTSNANDKMPPEFKAPYQAMINSVAQFQNAMAVYETAQSGEGEGEEGEEGEEE